MKKLSLFLIASVLLNSLLAQSYDPDKVDKKAIKLYNQAMVEAQDGRLTNAAELLQQAIGVDNKYLEAYLSLAGVYGQQKNYKSSIEYYEKAFAQDAGYTIEYKLPYSINLAGMGEFSRALDAINELLEKDPPKNSTSLKAAQYRKRSYEFAVEYEKKNPNKTYVFAPKNMGEDINTAESEYFPSLTFAHY
jgi:tetratricopeptide (TPR) repeat protein